MLHSIPALPVADIARSVEFYEGQLGFVVIHREGGFAVLRSGQVDLHLWQAGDESWREREYVQEPIVSGAESFLAGTASCRIEVDEVDELHAMVQPLGILHPNAPLRDEWYGTREFSIVDPDNNLLTFFELRQVNSDSRGDGGT